MNFYYWFIAIFSIGFGCITPTLTKDDDGKVWAVLFCGLNYYRYSYGMEAGLYKMYNTLIQGGIPKENIIVVASNELAYHRYNVNPGSVMYANNETDIFQAPNYYEEIAVDYSEIITPLQFMNILSGNSSDYSLTDSGSGRIIKSGPKDKIFMYYHGLQYFGALWLNNWYDLYAETFVPFLEKLKEDGKFDKMFWILECNGPGSMFDNYLDNDKNILIYALGGRYNEFTMCHYNSAIRTYTSICASSRLHKYLDATLASNGGRETILDTFINERYTDWQNYETVRNLYGEIELAKDKISTYLGTGHKITKTKVDLELLNQEAKSLERTSLREAMMNDDELLAPEQRRYLMRTMQNVIKSSMEDTDHTMETVSNGDVGTVAMEYQSCATKVTRALHSKCFKAENRFMAVFESDKFAKLCSLNIPEEKILSSINRHCGTQYE